MQFASLPTKVLIGDYAISRQSTPIGRA